MEENYNPLFYQHMNISVLFNHVIEIHFFFLNRPLLPYGFEGFLLVNL
jgi:hypothetical protein